MRASKSRRKAIKNKDISGFAILAILMLCVGALAEPRLLPYMAVPAAAICLVVFFRSERRRKRERTYFESGMADVDKLTGEEFEYFLSYYFKNLGFQTRVTPDTNDYGADIVAEKDGEKIVVQAKRYKGRVGVAAVQEVFGSKSFYKADKAMVVTSGYFTPNAKNLAAECGVELWDRDKLKAVMEKIQGKQLMDEMKETTEFQALSETCPKCGGHLVLRNGKHGTFYSCENYPDCKFTKPC